jgi:hypothetical protein
MSVYILMNGFDVEHPCYIDGVFTSVSNATLILINLLLTKGEHVNCYFLTTMTEDLVVYENAKGFKHWIKKFSVF